MSGGFQACSANLPTNLPRAHPLLSVIVTERDPEFTSSLTDLWWGAQTPYILYAHAILLSAVAPQPHGRAGDTLRVINKGWTLSLSWRCSRTSDGRGDIGASIWTRWGLSSFRVSSDLPAVEGPSLASEEDSALVAIVYITHTMITSCLGDVRSPPPHVHSVEGDSAPGLKSRDWGSWPVWSQAGHCPWSPGSSSLKQW